MGRYERSRFLRARRTGGPAPAIEISTNSKLSRKKPDWIDFDAGILAATTDAAAVDEAFAELVFEAASGKETKNERSDQRDIGIFKDGVAL